MWQWEISNNNDDNDDPLATSSAESIFGPGNKQQETHKPQRTNTNVCAAGKTRCRPRKHPSNAAQYAPRQQYRKKIKHFFTRVDTGRPPFFDKNNPKFAFIFEHGFLSHTKVCRAFAGQMRYRMYLILPPPLLQEINRLWR
jgi:hypothetical protein